MNKILFPVLFSCLLHSAAAAAEADPPKALSLAQGEQLAVDLRQGMTPLEVQKLLGKPKRTALKTQGYSGPPESAHGTLHWTYAWTGASQSDRSLQVVFASKSAGRWLVNSWDWAGY